MYKYAPDIYARQSNFNKVEEFYINCYKEDRIKNIQQVSNEVANRQPNDILDTKITNYANINGFDKQELINQINTNKIVASFFAKDPLKQSCYQTYAIKYINNNYAVESAIILPAAGKNALFVDNGRILQQADYPIEKTGDTKSIDFKIVVETNSGRRVTLYCSHKHTTKNGGTQDNQWHDLMCFLKAANSTTTAELPDIYFIALADGDYYNNIVPKTSTTRMQLLRDCCVSQNVFAMHTAELGEFIAAL